MNSNSNNNKICTIPSRSSQNVNFRNSSRLCTTRKNSANHCLPCSFRKKNLKKKKGCAFRNSVASNRFPSDIKATSTESQVAFKLSKHFNLTLFPDCIDKDTKWMQKFQNFTEKQLLNTNTKLHSPKENSVNGSQFIKEKMDVLSELFDPVYTLDIACKTKGVVKLPVVVKPFKNIYTYGEQHEIHPNSSNSKKN